MKEETIADYVNEISIIVTTYNPDIELLNKNLISYACQVGLVLVCDNSDECNSQQAVKNLIV